MLLDGGHGCNPRVRPHVAPVVEQDDDDDDYDDDETVVCNGMVRLKTLESVI